jgi:homoserine kinase
MGGSAASSVAALVAANALLDAPLTREALYPFALEGEAVASGGRHGDNVGPMLLGGLVLASADRICETARAGRAGIACWCIRTGAGDTPRARGTAGSYELQGVRGAEHESGAWCWGCERGDAALVRAGLSDVLVEPRRAPLIRASPQ